MLVPCIRIFNETLPLHGSWKHNKVFDKRANVNIRTEKVLTLNSCMSFLKPEKPVFLFRSFFENKPLIFHGPLCDRMFFQTLPNFFSSTVSPRLRADMINSFDVDYVKWFLVLRKNDKTNLMVKGSWAFIVQRLKAIRLFWKSKFPDAVVFSMLQLIVCLRW